MRSFALLGRFFLMLLFGWSTLFLGSCTSGGGNGGQDGNLPDGQGDDLVDNDNPPPKQIKWSQPMEVDLEEAGLQLSLQVTPDGQFAIAYYKALDELSECTNPILGGPPTPVLQDQVRYARYDGSLWQHQTVETIESTMLTGISLIFDGSSPLIAYLGGTEGLQVCGGTDLMIARGNGSNFGTPTAAVLLSNEASAGGDCPKMQAVCDFGDVVGLWPSLAKASNGTIGVAYRDVHNGYEKESTDSSDAEYAFSSGGGWSHEWIDLAHSGGDFNSLVFGTDNEPAVTYYSGKYGTIQFAKRPWRDWTLPEDCTSSACSNGQTCGADKRCACTSDAQCGNKKCVGERCSVVIAKMQNGLPEKSISMAVGPDGRYLVAYFDVDSKNLRLAQSTDGIAWTNNLVDSVDSTGMYPSMVIDPVTQKPAIAYYRCGKYQDGLNCNRNYDGLRYATFTGTYPDELLVQAKWKKVDVSNDTNAFDGKQASLGIAPDGRIGVAYQYSWIDQGTPKTHLMFKLGTWE